MSKENKKIYTINKSLGTTSYHCLNCGEGGFEPFTECGICGLKIGDDIDPYNTLKEILLKGSLEDAWDLIYKNHSNRFNRKKINQEWISGRVSYDCERCGKNSARFNGQDIICLNCGYEPVILKTIVSDFLNKFIEDVGLGPKSYKRKLIIEFMEGVLK